MSAKKIRKKEKVVKDEKPNSIAIMYAFLLVGMVFCQLFNFEEYLNLIESFWLPGGELFSRFLGTLIVVGEVLALPSLLKMKIEPILFRISLLLALIMPIIWLVLSTWLETTTNAVSNIGFFGTVTVFQPGWGARIFCLCLILMACVSVWPVPVLKKFKL